MRRVFVSLINTHYLSLINSTSRVEAVRLAFSVSYCSWDIHVPYSSYGDVSAVNHQLTCSCDVINWHLMNLFYYSSNANTYTLSNCKFLSFLRMLTSSLKHKCVECSVNKNQSSLSKCSVESLSLPFGICYLGNSKHRHTDTQVLLIMPRCACAEGIR